jgi:asparagine synthase (glutamine-hydrolysing)
MCGIAGYINWDGQAGLGGVSEMVNHMEHRGPDDSGLWRSSDTLCVLGHTRLSIIDLSPNGHQPMIDPETGNTIAFNGEIYNYQRLRRECEVKGDHFFSQSDTEVILALFRRHGTDCLKYLRGMFAFAIWNKKKQELFMACDRVGKKPLNYALLRNGIVFSSEIDPMVHHPEINRQLDEEALDLYLQLQYIPPPWTIYKDIKKLPAAYFAIYNRQGLTLRQYWDVDYHKKIMVTEEEASEALEEMLIESVKSRMVADVPVGALLSGGVDSSLVVAIMASLSGEPVKTFSIGFEENGLNELPYAQEVAKRYQTDHHEEIIKGDVTGNIENIAKHYGEPFADPSAIPSFYVCKIARNHVKVALNGDGGDELLGGYPRYYLSPQSIKLGKFFRNIHSANKLSRWVSEFEEANNFLSRFKRGGILRWVHPEMQSFTMYYPFFKDKERKALFPNEHLEGDAILPKWREKWLKMGMAAAGNPIERMLWIDNRTYLPGALLVKMDIASMHCGLEMRSPLLDYEVIEFCAGIPVKFKVKNGKGKYLLKKLGEKYLSKELLYRGKMGFGIPLTQWLKGHLHPLVREILLSPNIMEPLNIKVIKEIIDQFYDLNIEHSQRIWVLLMFGLWKKVCYYGR